MYRQKPQRRRHCHRIICLVGVCLAHRGRAVQEYLRVHLPFIGEQLDEILLKAAVQIPVDAADIVPQHILAVVRKLNRLPVRPDQVLPAEKSGQVRTQAQCAGLQTAEECVIQVRTLHSGSSPCLCPTAKASFPVYITTSSCRSRASSFPRQCFPWCPRKQRCRPHQSAC